MLIRHPIRTALAAMFVFVSLQAGCSSKGGSSGAATRKGVVKAIDLANRKVVMTTSKGDGTEFSLEGTYTDETVVRINGRVMTIKDIKVGDKVEVVGRKEGSGTNRQLIATEVKITRNESDWQETGKSDKPASGAGTESGE
ncbi:MAG TPA: hypothetical protein P5081_19460 [Phycisphaerae bacterium]|nr:hypothetical protein [Phycisphaerae bacterium]HRW55054.1 hypothetical protein [Phycisphaerae bacterium]